MSNVTMQYRVSAYIFANNLLQHQVQRLPREHFDVLLNHSRSRLAIAHDYLEEIIAVWMSLCDSKRMVSFDVASNAILLLNVESGCDKVLQQTYSVDTSNVGLFLPFPPDAADDDVGA